MPTTLDPPEKPRGDFRLTGRHVLFILIAAFGFVFAVNGYMIWRAIGSFPGVVTESSFRDNQRFNAELAAAKAQADRGWQVDVKTDHAADGRTVISLVAHDRDGQPLTGVAFQARLEHPADRSRDHKIALAPVVGASDRFEGRLDGVGLGKWGLVIEGVGAAGRLYLSHNTVFFE
jgi:nitrogen fixation protein FixH